MIEMFSKVIEVVDVDNGVTGVSCKLDMEGVPKSQARPRLGRWGFCNPNSKAKAAFKEKIETGILKIPIFNSTHGCQHLILHWET